jgi:hypothetical protein
MSVDDHLCIVDVYLVAVNLDGDGFTENGVGVGQRDHIGGHHVARDHLVQQDVLELFEILRLEQAFDRSGEP